MITHRIFKMLKDHQRINLLQFVPIIWTFSKFSEVHFLSNHRVMNRTQLHPMKKSGKSKKVEVSKIEVSNLSIQLHYTICILEFYGGQNGKIISFGNELGQ